ncbi:MAG TPA: hypothetical protein VF556_16405 [Pyrinomonadaceae bacterium]|jgi:hypothetical protein
MKVKDVRNWLGIYFLIITGILGTYVLLFGETVLLPVSKQEAMDVFQIVIPVLIGQLTIIFRWFAGFEAENTEASINMPTWVIKGPPLLVVGILIITVTLMVVGNMFSSLQWTISPDQFKVIVTFCVSILNATTIFIIGRYFKMPQVDKQEN